MEVMRKQNIKHSISTIIEKGTLTLSVVVVIGYGCLLGGSIITHRQEQDEVIIEVPNTAKEKETLPEKIEEVEKPEKQEGKEIAKENATPKQSQEPTKTTSQGGTCHDWMRQAGITDMENAYILIMRESSCNPNAVNSSSGACGIGQQLPCGKWEHTWNEPVGAMIDMQKYVMQRYGSWANAVRFHDSHNWY